MCIRDRTKTAQYTLDKKAIGGPLTPISNSILVKVRSKDVTSGGGIILPEKVSGACCSCGGMLVPLLSALSSSLLLLLFLLSSWWLLSVVAFAQVAVVVGVFAAAVAVVVHTNDLPGLARKAPERTRRETTVSKRLQGRETHNRPQAENCMHLRQIRNLGAWFR